MVLIHRVTGNKPQHVFLSSEDASEFKIIVAIFMEGNFQSCKTSWLEKGMFLDIWQLTTCWRNII